MGGRRSNRVEERVALGIALIVGVAASFSPASPTGNAAVDAVLVGLSVAAVSYAGASAPWWVIVLAAGAATTVAVEPILVAIGGIAMALGVWIGVRRRSASHWRVASVGISLNVLTWAGLDTFFGITSIVGVAVGVLVFVFGIRRRPRAIRRRVWAVSGALAGGTLLCAGAFAFGALNARDEAAAAQRHVSSGISSLNRGNFDEAADQFEQATTSLRRAEERLGNPLVSGAGVLPVLSQHRTFALELTQNGAALTQRVADALRQIDVEALQLNGGALDLNAIASLDEPLGEIDAALGELSAIVESSDSPWLLPEFRDRLASLRDDVEEFSPQLETIREAVAVTPGMLGADGPRTYLVLFTTPAEARGLGGFPGNYAELTIDQGQIRMTDFGRVRDLELAARDAGARITGPQGFLENYGTFGFNVDGQGLVGQAPLRNVTMAPHFPWVGEVVSELYPQMTGRSIDGVIAVDPYVVATLLQYSGPVQLTEVPFRLTAENAADFLLRDQYTIEQRGERIDALDEAGRLMFDALLTGEVPNPSRLANDLSPLVAERRLLAWTNQEQEQELLRDVGVLGELPQLDGGDGWSVAVNNAGASKIDSFLEVTTAYESTFDSGVTSGTLTANLTNTAPASGLPEYVIGNAIGLPPGTSRLYVEFFSAMPLDSATIDGAPVTLSPGRMEEWYVYRTTVDIPAGATVSVELTFSGRIDPTRPVTTWTQPLARSVG